MFAVFIAYRALVQESAAQVLEHHSKCYLACKEPSGFYY